MKKARIIAYYLPQYHPIPENDEVWGKGFTEWTNVVQAKPLFRGHNQPRIPADLGFYDLRLSESREAQAALARGAGIEGFMYWHYWFGNGKQLLERPFNEVLQKGKPDFPFCLGWANHTWATKTWTAKAKSADMSRIIVKQTYPGTDDHIAHFYSLLPAFKDSRYILVDGKPLFLIYNILDMPDFKEFISLWNDLAIENGLRGIHFVGNVMGHVAEKNIDNIINSGTDATAVALLNKAELKSEGRLGYYLKKIKSRINFIGPETYEYSNIIKHLHSEYDVLENVYPVVYPQLDRTPRAGKNAVILKNSSPILFKKYLEETIESIQNKEEDHRIIFINAWNEWGEGNYLEPDLLHGHGYLNAIRDVLN